MAITAAAEFMSGGSRQPPGVVRTTEIGKPLTWMAERPLGVGIPANAVEATAEMEGVDEPYYLSVDKHVLTNFVDRRGGICSSLAEMEQG